MRKYENVCAALDNLMDIGHYHEPSACQASMIVDEDVWLAALQARNNVAHSYNKAVALDIIQQTREKFCGMFQGLKETVEREWL